MRCLPALVGLVGTIIGTFETQDNVSPLGFFSQLGLLRLLVPDSHGLLDLVLAIVKTHGHGNQGPVGFALILAIPRYLLQVRPAQQGSNLAGVTIARLFRVSRC